MRSASCIALLLAILIMTIFAPKAAYAQSLHAVLLRSDPVDASVLARPPTAVRLWFSERVQLVGQSIQVLAPSGAVVRTGAVRQQGLELSMPIEATQPGTYLVTWQVISQDTDPVSGSFTFSVRHTGGVWAETAGSGGSITGFWLQVLAHLLHFLGYALGFGTFAFLRLVLVPLNLVRVEFTRRLWRLVNLGILALVVAEVIALLAQIVSLSNGVLPILTTTGAILASSFGRVMAQRLGAALLLWVLLGIAQERERDISSAVLALGVALAFVDGEASHALTSRMLWPALIVNAIHIAAMGIWLGGLIALVMLWRNPALKPRRNAVVLLFGRLALIAVIELVLTGILLSWLYLPRLTDLLTTAYGRVLAIKMLSLLAPLLLVIASRRVDEDRRTRWWVRESGVLIGIVTLAATLISLPPPTP